MRRKRFSVSIRALASVLCLWQEPVVPVQGQFACIMRRPRVSHARLRTFVRVIPPAISDHLRGRRWNTIERDYTRKLMRASERMRKFHRFITMFDVVLSRFDSSSRLINFSASNWSTIERLREEEGQASCFFNFLRFGWETKASLLLLFRLLRFVLIGGLWE